MTISTSVAFIIGIVIGLGAGVVFGIVLLALCVAAGREKNGKVETIPDKDDGRKDYDDNGR